MANKQLIQLDPLVGGDEDSIFVMQKAGGGVNSTGGVEAAEARRLGKFAREPFPTLADLEADTKVEAGDFVSTLGFSTTNDRGGNDYEIGTFGVADGVFIIDLPGSGLQARRLNRVDIEVNSVAEMDALPFLYIGDSVEYLGYTTAGDGGGNKAEVGTGFGPADNGSVFDLGGSGLQARGLFPGGVVDSMQWGVSEKAFHVSPAGDDGNPGSAAAPFLTPQAALDYMLSLGTVFRGSFGLELAAGTYAPIKFNDVVETDNAIFIRGPDVGGHPNVPTAIIDGTSTPSGRGVDLSRNLWVSIENIKIQNLSSGTGIVNGLNNQLSATNVHQFNNKFGISTLHTSFFSATGGLWDGNNIADSIGYRSFYNSTHEMTQPSPAGAIEFFNWDRGVLVNEGVQGHIDFMKIYDCNVGLNIKRGAGAINTSQAAIDGCDVGVLVENNGWFNNGIVFGDTTPNTVNVRQLGSSPELKFLTESNSARTIRTLQNGNIAAHTGTTVNTDLFTTISLPDWSVSERGPIAEIEISGDCTLTAPCTIQVVIDINGNLDLLGEVIVPASATSFHVESTVFYTSSSEQRASTRLISDSGVDANFRINTGANIKDLEHNYILRAQLGDSADSIRYAAIFLKGTHGG